MSNNGKIKSMKPYSNTSKFKQGYFVPRNPQKYIGDLAKIIFRSSWELKFCIYCDQSDNILSWSSEPIGIKYWNPLDNKEHNYYLDFYARIQKDGKTQDYFIEIKPEKQTKKPVITGKKTLKKLTAHNQEMKTYAVNIHKFLAAKAYAESLGYKFLIVTEKFLFGNGKSKEKV